MSRAPRRRVMLVAGEASGDQHAARLIACLRRGDDVECYGMGGDQMRAAGMRVLVDSTPLSVVGIFEILRHYPALRRALLTMKQALRDDRPDLLVLIDYPEFNFKLARTAKRLGIRVLLYISPQLWAWRSGRVRRIRRDVDRLAVILPFEQEFYAKHGVAADYVGHPLIEDIADAVEDRGDADAGTDTPAAPDPTRKTVLLLPGSRLGEVERLLPVLCETAALLAKRCNGNAAFRLLPAPGLDTGLFAPCLNHSGFDCRLADGGSYREMKAADVAISATGTAILQLALCGTPTIGIYRVSGASYWILKCLVKVPHVSLVNIIAGREVIPEFLQYAATPAALCGTAFELLTDEARRRAMQRAFDETRRVLGRARASEKTAQIIHEMLP